MVKMLASLNYLCIFLLESYYVVVTAEQGWVFAMAKSIFARTVEKNGKNWNIQNCTETPQFR